MSDWVIRLIEQSGYLGVGFLMFLETIFPPIPSEVIMPVAGMAAAKGKLGFVPVVASGTAGAMLGNTVWYLAARSLGILRLRPLIDRYGRWLTEINVTSPTGIVAIDKFNGTDTPRLIWDAIDARLATLKAA